MNLKRYDRYQMDFTGNWMKASLASMGLSVFLLAVYYFGWLNLSTVKIGKVILGLIFPMLLCLGYIVLLRFMKLNAPGVYGILGAALCLVLMGGNILAGGMVRMILSIVGYALCGVIIIFCAGGFLPGRLPASLAFGCAFAVRLLFFDLLRFRKVNWLEEAAVLLILLALTCLPMTFKSTKKA